MVTQSQRRKESKDRVATVEEVLNKEKANDKGADNTTFLFSLLVLTLVSTIEYNSIECNKIGRKLIRRKWNRMEGN